MPSTSLMDSSDRIQLPSSSPEAMQEQALVHCPRCDSTHTKFCYYNNYSLSQPRYFCRSCRRYWTKGGTLRNIPVGGVCRKNKKLSRKPTTHHHRQHRPDGNVIDPNSESLDQISYLESASAQFSVYPSYTESSEYEYGAGYLPAMVANGGYGADTHELSLFGEMEDYKNMMNAVDVKPRAFALQ